MHTQGSLCSSWQSSKYDHNLSDDFLTYTPPWILLLSPPPLPWGFLMQVGQQIYPAQKLKQIFCWFVLVCFLLVLFFFGFLTVDFLLGTSNPCWVFRSWWQKWLLIHGCALLPFKTLVFLSSTVAGYVSVYYVQILLARCWSFSMWTGGVYISEDVHSIL